MLINPGLPRISCESASTSEKPAPMDDVFEPDTTTQRPVTSRTKTDRILIVDDEVNARTALAELLREEGYAVETAADGFKALPKLEEFAPDLLLTDLKMPGLDGITLMRKARDLDPDLAVVVMTAFGAVDAAAPWRIAETAVSTAPLNLEELTLS